MSEGENQNLNGNASTVGAAIPINIPANSTGSLDFGNLMAKTEKMPSVLRGYFFSDEIASAREQVYTKNGVTDEDEAVCFVTELHVLSGELKLADFPDALWSRLDWPDSNRDKAIQLVADMLGYVFMPVSAFVGDVVGILHELDVNPKAYPEKAIEARVISYKKASEEIIEALEIKGLSESDVKRLRHIIESHLRDVRDDIETRRMLIKPRKTGGLELTEAEADRIMKFADDEMRMTRYVEEEPENGETLTADNNSVRSEFTSEEIKAILAGSPDEQKKVAKRIEALVEKTNGDVEMVREMLNSALYSETLEIIDAENVIAALLVFARQGNLIATLMDDKRFQGVIRAYFEQLGKPVDRIILSEPAGPMAMNYFLQIVLRGIAQLSEADSARYGLRVINALKKKGETQYVELVAFDMDQGKFVWTDPIDL